MSARTKTLVCVCVLSIGLVACGATLLVAAVGHTTDEQPTQIPAKARNTPARRNLSLQPEASKMVRRLGARFLSDNTTSALVGTLTIDSVTRPVQMMRKQSKDGESVEIRVEGSELLSWDTKQGALAADQKATGNKRELIERLVFDSPDQFVLMQLRGASYYTVAQSVRPADASDGYEGPLWTIVRVDDPERDEAKKPASPWRLYYINTTTGLIDRIESEVEGRRIVAEISSWTEQNGEQLPAQIVWTRDGQTLMQYSLTNFSQSQN
jgi:hypothetical protein